jgi:hypothetical protein
LAHGELAAIACQRGQGVKDEAAQAMSTSLPVQVLLLPCCCYIWPAYISSLHKHHGNLLLLVLIQKLPLVEEARLVYQLHVKNKD